MYFTSMQLTKAILVVAVDSNLYFSSLDALLRTVKYKINCLPFTLQLIPKRHNRFAA